MLLIKQVNKPVPPTEMIQTFADMSVTEECLNFKPTFSLKEGKKNTNIICIM